MQEGGSEPAQIVRNPRSPLASPNHGSAMVAEGGKHTNQNTSAPPLVWMMGGSGESLEAEMLERFWLLVEGNAR